MRERKKKTRKRSRKRKINKSKRCFFPGTVKKTIHTTIKERGSEDEKKKEFILKRTFESKRGEREEKEGKENSQY